ncbi:Cof-type HAD-IIB family hydrolase [Anaerocolumna sedimenticola]|uniref:Cof-type HAD-IIB family hydrolase n=1 Tax=Anaerocolumna sedimenticola TaxID=2696063 RepID=A0A6P1TT64_9FIRM|nr:Cof-type HAD-IIB family hydrolase [Anaerocolumna sedimenticola]QHQ62906.1 Cof-type HAD-IIB family hydrolase [Anaerocolumna sedimenticola]
MKLVVFDLDDTLLNSKEEVSERNRKAILNCSQKGMKIGYITVRSPRKIKTFLQGLPCDCIANYNGAVIYADNKLIVANTIKYDNAINYINKVTEIAPGIGICAYFEPYCYKNKEIRSYITQEILKYDLYSTPKQNFQRIRLFYNGYENIDFSKYISSEMQYQKSQDSAMITNKLADKGTALESLIRYFGFKKEQIISFGDSINDIPMLKTSGTGVAMGNAVSKLKDIADYIALSNDEDGVAEYIEAYLL